MESMKINIPGEKRALIQMYKALLRKSKPYIKNAEDSKHIRSAFDFAVDAHKDMRRRSGEPYIYHPIAVAMIAVSEIGLGITSIVAALLHDVVEDTKWELKDIRERFGGKVENIVDGLTKISNNDAASMQAENFRKMLINLSKDIRIVLIKIADRLHNMRTLDAMPKDKQLKIKAETQFIYAPLANRLGLHTIKTELEDLSLKFSDRKTYEEIVEKFAATKVTRARVSRKFIRPIEEKLKEKGYKFTIKARNKSIHSIYTKMQKQQIPFEEVYDLFAIRIICDDLGKDEKKTCFNIYCIVTEIYTPNTDRFRDWVTQAKQNGYEALHTTVMGPDGDWTEVQIRTKRMDDIAEKGYAAHWKYKENVTKESNIEKWLRDVREYLQNNDINAIEFLDDFQASLNQDEVFAFTPKGELIKLTYGATVLDFAFAIHTELGMKTLGAKVNGKLVPLSHQIKDAEQVEIITSTQPKANEGWLKYVVTTKAKTRIKEHLKGDKKLLAKEGIEIIRRKLRHIKVELDNQIIQQLMAFFDMKSELDLFYSVGASIISHTDIKGFRNSQTAKEQSSKIYAKNTKDLKKKIKEVCQNGDELILDQAIPFKYSIATCCQPIPGDEVFGFNSVNGGIKIHKANCPNGNRLMTKYGYRIIHARWKSQKDREFQFNIFIEGINRLGIIHDISKLLTKECGINIELMDIKAKDGFFRGRISLMTSGRDEVEALLKQIKALEYVEKVVRYDLTKATTSTLASH